MQSYLKSVGFINVFAILFFTYEPKGRGFESLLAHHMKSAGNHGITKVPGTFFILFFGPQND